MVLNKLQEVGFLVKKAKLILTPTHRIQHLGFTIDTTIMTLTASTNKIRDLRREASQVLRSGRCNVRQLSSFLGKGQALTVAVFAARLKTRYLMQAKIQALHINNDSKSTIKLEDQSMKELRW
jgi:hypothetical protein